MKWTPLNHTKTKMEQNRFSVSACFVFAPFCMCRQLDFDENWTKLEILAKLHPVIFGHKTCVIKLDSIIHSFDRLDPSRLRSKSKANVAL